MITLQPNEIWTIPAVRAYAMQVSNSQQWEYGARRLAKTRGVCNVHRADDTLTVFTAEAGKVHRKSHKPGTWRIDRGVGA
jgi:hypothetical protein